VIQPPEMQSDNIGFFLISKRKTFVRSISFLRNGSYSKAAADYSGGPEACSTWSLLPIPRLSFLRSGSLIKIRQKIEKPPITREATAKAS